MCILFWSKFTPGWVRRNFFLHFYYRLLWIPHTNSCLSVNLIKCIYEKISLDTCNKNRSCSSNLHYYNITKPISHWSFSTISIIRITTIQKSDISSNSDPFINTSWNISNEGLFSIRRGPIHGCYINENLPLGLAMQQMLLKSHEHIKFKKKIIIKKIKMNLKLLESEILIPIQSLNYWCYHCW